MNTLSTYNSGTLTITVTGRVDSSVAPQFQKDVEAAVSSLVEEKTISQLSDITELVVDAHQLEYISSMGLRVLLQLRRKYKSMSITGCSTDVFNVFKMTGFTSILNIERALPEISISNLREVPGLKDIYQLTDETMLKVFPTETTRDDVDRIVKLTKRAFIMEIPTPMTFEIMQMGDRIGLIYEKVTPTEVDAKTLGTLLREMHERIIEPNGIIPSAAARVREQIQCLKPYLGDDCAAKLKQMFVALPEGSSLLHGHLTYDKAIKHNGEAMIMDMSQICYGNPVIDLAHLYSSLPEDKRGEFFDEMLRAYYDIESEDTIERNKQNIVTFSVIMHFTALLHEGEPSEKSIEAASKEFEERIASRWDEILSHLHFKMDFNEEIRKLERKRFYTDSDVNIDWVAETLGTNRHYVSDYFNKVLHTTFSDYINTQRLDYAVELLRSGRVPSSQISYTVGFNNDHTFRRLFKQRFGCTPSQFEK